MPTFFNIDGVKIEFFYNEHDPPHFHASIAEYEGLVNIDDPRIMRGILPKNKKRRLLKWAEDNKTMLMEIWNSMRIDD